MDGSKPRVLIVEDNADLRDMYVQFAKQTGCEAYSLKDGTDAVETCLFQGIDIVFLDVYMPNTDGLTVLQSIRTYTKKVIVIGISCDDVILQTARRLGANEVVYKPLTLEIFTRLIEKYEACGDQSC